MLYQACLMRESVTQTHREIDAANLGIRKESQRAQAIQWDPHRLIRLNGVFLFTEFYQHQSLIYMNQTMLGRSFARRGF